MIDKIINTIKQNDENWKQFQDLLIEKDVASKTILLNEGEISNNIYFIKKGCLREWFNKDGKDITFQFFFEGQPVASIDSFINREPSLFTIESIEPSTILTIGKADFEKLLNFYPEFKTGFQDFMFLRFRNYGQLFLSRIKDTPAERYEDLLKNHPEIVNVITSYSIHYTKLYD